MLNVFLILLLQIIVRINVDYLLFYGKLEESLTLDPYEHQLATKRQEQILLVSIQEGEHGHNFNRDSSNIISCGH